MPTTTPDDEHYMQLATKIPKALHRRLKLHAVEHDTHIMTLVIDALRDRLARVSS